SPPRKPPFQVPISGWYTNLGQPKFHEIRSSETRLDSLENPPAQAAASRVTLYPWASSLPTPPIFILRCAPQRMPTRLGACAWTVASANKRREKSRRGAHECVRHACAAGPPHD